MIELDVPGRRLHLDVSDESSRRGSPTGNRRSPRPDGGWVQLYHDHVGGADTGADLDFLKGCRGKAVGRDSH